MELGRELSDVPSSLIGGNRCCSQSRLPCPSVNTINTRLVPHHCYGVVDHHYNRPSPPPIHRPPPPSLPPRTQYTLQLPRWWLWWWWSGCGCDGGGDRGTMFFRRFAKKSGRRILFGEKGADWRNEDQREHVRRSELSWLKAMETAAVGWYTETHQPHAHHHESSDCLADIFTRR